MRGRYTLDADGDPREEKDLLAWAQWLEKAGDSRVVARTRIGDSEVSTVFLGLDHSFGSGPPALYETMVFGGKLDGTQQRYSTKSEAEAGHAATVSKVRNNR